MYGLVNRAVKELIESTAGPQAWLDVCAEAGVDIDYFEAMEPYDDAITYDLVAAASSVLDTPADEILEGFGRYWILYTGAEGWGPILDSQGSTVAEVVSNLDDMHVRIQATMPSLVMPRFNIVQSNSSVIRLEYHSEREGLAPMVLGLMKGLAERCGESWHTVQVGYRSDSGFDTFELTAAPAPADSVVAADRPRNETVER